jgi:predicted 2-oxoglutarate/Fe(II)-dependent dioxygenase YbiX
MEYPILRPTGSSVVPYLHVPYAFCDLAEELPEKGTRFVPHSSFDGIDRHMGLFDLDQNDYRHVYNRVEGTILHLQEAVWGFNLYSWHQELRINRYKAGDGFPLHTDLGGVDHTKLIAVVELGEGDYDGGELSFVTNHNEGDAAVRTVRMKKGDLVLLPGWTTHRVEPITRGTRYSLTGWFAGPSFV